MERFKNIELATDASGDYEIKDTETGLVVNEPRKIDRVVVTIPFTGVSEYVGK